MLALSHISDPSDPFSVQSCSSQLRCPTQIVAATHDRIAGFESVRELFDAISGSPLSADVTYEYLETGHLAPFEEPNRWRNLVLKFLLS